MISTNSLGIPDNLFEVENYLEAAGVLNSIKNGIDPSSIRRPFKTLDPFGTSDISRDLKRQMQILK